MNNIPKEIQDQVAYLKALHYLVNGTVGLTSTHRHISRRAKLDKTKARDALWDLKINECVMAPNVHEISMTTTGLKAVNNPLYLFWDRPTNNYFNFRGKVADSSFYFNIINISPAFQGIVEFLKELKTELPYLAIDDEQKGQIELNIAVIQEEIAKKRPKLDPIKTALKNIKDVLKNLTFHTSVRVLLFKLENLITKQLF